ncbi:tRNA preQ1(34) S-adenosylmethionine ribosyltransferase-isomerase QueA [Patescibacteria group bacterium]|uniref:S-adenosylmethionine:tRNA ribosyltransferase-isomerase n=1 Tax=candidate division WWE3 bacterium TaxID=2053526 RepID=A0A928TU51_UNCKA|nr:tRNA preQ1(34) S-adenosylmethionine ribosyltransferase-isomerase QueA [candidate division WWE3 bacterium]MCL4732351.1 tRNA preQ1(34) S-adenosylmethionine ribosyltransferase-isomerase QueA [Patescibacteria group bacterium]MDL1952776.1 tRNA preQ1(34) S-adenosylmethionine ribosyltransferase-isomerase QueA [Candidatus Uhrbacteria bacterium UHB]RIL01012.1 MAG: tRNA preQ1(34) S-adenosylmethionine ribosyltransferase-isomerase QueA [Candidatus Uhrbacteria bacterium]
MKTELFDYPLPKDRIAQKPIRPRDHSRLMILDRMTGDIWHRHFFDIIEYLKPGDLLVLNITKVFKARLLGSTDSGPVELFLLHPDNSRVWLALGKPGKKLPSGSRITFADGMTCRIHAKRNNGTLEVDFDAMPKEVIAWANERGHIPVPPYIGTEPEMLDEYQTVYAESVGSVAAPTAGFHFTPELIGRLKHAGIDVAAVTLHVGMGTFRPMRTETLKEHHMHEEWVSVPRTTAEKIRETKERGGRVIAVGTTTVRALESGMQEGFTSLFITPGYSFKIVDGLITNFHLPKSTLLVLVSAFLGEQHATTDWGRTTLLRAYATAIREGYRFYSFGDAMLIL